MATATKQVPPASPFSCTPAERVPSPSLLDRLAGLSTRSIGSWHRSSWRSLLGTLAATLAYATFFESWYGTGAAQEWIYAALVRHPAGVPGDEHPLRGPDPLPLEEAADRLRDHARRAPDPPGRLVLQRADGRRRTGRACSRATSRASSSGSDYPVIRVWEVDPHTRKRIPRFDLPFQPGTFEWGPGRPRPWVWRRACWGSCHSDRLGSADAYQDVLTPARRSVPVRGQGVPAGVGASGVHVADPDGAPMARMGSSSRAPDAPRRRTFRSRRSHWFVTERKFYRVVRSQRPATDRLLLRRPPRAGRGLPQAADGRRYDGVARFRYQRSSRRGADLRLAARGTGRASRCRCPTAT